jgi:hypothetical protein
MHGNGTSNSCQTPVGIEFQANNNVSFMNLILGNREFHSSLYGNWRWYTMCNVMALYGKWNTSSIMLRLSL